MSLLAENGVMVGRHSALSSFFLCLIIYMAAWNAVLRPSVDLAVTPYYIIAPFLAVYLYCYVVWTRAWFFIFFLFAAYGFAVGSFYGVPNLMQLAQLLKYAQLLIFFALMSCIFNLDKHGPEKLRSIVVVLVFLVFLIAVVQLVTGFEFPTVVNDESALWLNTFFFTPNDLALFLCGAFCLVLRARISFLFKLLFFAAFFAICIRNDAKAALLATVIMGGTYYLIGLFSRLRLRPVTGLFFLFALVLLSVWLLQGVTLSFGETEFDFVQLFVDPFDRIADLHPYNLGGSIFDRTDALIYSIVAFNTTGWLGLGPGGSVYTLSLPAYELLTAKSLHNALAEFFFEFGPFALITMYFALGKFWRALFAVRPSAHQKAILAFVAAAPLLSVSQSSGFISNYSFWLTVFLIWSDRYSLTHAEVVKPVNLTPLPVVPQTK